MLWTTVIALVWLVAAGIGGPAVAHAPDCPPAPRSAPVTPESATVLLAVDGMM